MGLADAQRRATVRVRWASCPPLILVCRTAAHAFQIVEDEVQVHDRASFDTHLVVCKAHGDTNGLADIAQD